METLYLAVVKIYPRGGIYGSYIPLYPSGGIYHSSTPLVIVQRYTYTFGYMTICHVVNKRILINAHYNMAMVSLPASFEVKTLS